MKGQILENIFSSDFKTKFKKNIRVNIFLNFIQNLERKLEECSNREDFFQKKFIPDDKSIPRRRLLRGIKSTVVYPVRVSRTGGSIRVDAVTK